VREAAPDTLIVSDGFSCRGQIQTAGRTPLHLAQVLQMSIRQHRAEPRASHLATRRLRNRRLLRAASLVAGVAGMALVASRL